MKYEKINVIDDRLVQHEPVVKMYRGAESSSKMVATPVGGAVNQSQVQFNINCTPSNYFDRRPMLKTVFTVQVTALNTTNDTPNGTVLTIPGSDVTMSAYPASNLFGMCDVSINGAQVCSYDMGKYASVLTKLSNVSKNMIKSTCASCPELSFATVNDGNYTLSNSQGNYNDSTNNYIGNGAWTFSAAPVNNTAAGGGILNAGGALVNGTPQYVTYQITSYEPLILPPFIYDSSHDNSEAIFGMNNLLITLNVNAGSAYRALRVVSPSKTTVAVGLASNASSVFNILSCELHYKTYRAPALIDFKLPSPVAAFHTYNFYNNFISSNTGFPTANITTGVSTVSNISMSNVVSTGMPSLILIWCDKGNTNYKSYEAKYSYPIIKLSIDLGTNQSMLSNYTLQDLYRLSEESGLEQSYLSYSGEAYALGFTTAGAIAAQGVSRKQLVGGPIVLRPGISFPLPSEVCTSSSGSFTWKFQADCITINTQDIAAAAVPLLNVMMIYDTWITIDTATLQCAVNKSMLTVPEVLGMSKSEAVTVEDTHAQNGGALQSHDVVKSGGAFRASGKLASRLKK